jgi:hypothetical protein
MPTNLTAVADYVVRWVAGAWQHHGVRVDFVGEWNERSLVAMLY